MTVTLYKCSDDPRTLSKNLTDEKSKTECTIYGDCSILAPTILLRYDATIIHHNYMYIADWGRYYFIDNITVSNGKQMVISGSVDVLQTYKESIKTCKGNCIRNEGIGRPTDVPDHEFPIKPASNFVTSLNIGSYFDIETENSDGTLHYLLSTK